MKTKHPFTASADADTPSKRITNPLEHSGGQDKRMQRIGIFTIFAASCCIVMH